MLPGQRVRTSPLPDRPESVGLGIVVPKHLGEPRRWPAAGRRTSGLVSTATTGSTREAGPTGQPAAVPLERLRKHRSLMRSDRRKRPAHSPSTSPGNQPPRPSPRPPLCPLPCGARGLLRPRLAATSQGCSPSATGERSPSTPGPGDCPRSAVREAASFVATWLAGLSD
jgi:hypothetical protein